MTNPIHYDPNTPYTKLSFADWQIQFIQNFTQLATAFAENHVPLDHATTAIRGNHTYVKMPEQTGDPQTGSQEFSIYSKDVDNQTDQLFFTYPGNTPVVQFTNYQIYSVTPTSRQTTYFTFLPGKLLIYFGTFGPFSGGSLETNILKLNPPVAKNILSVQLCTKGTTPKYTPAAVPTTFTLTVTPTFGYQAEQLAFVKEIALQPVEPSSDNTVFYFVVANI